MVEKEIQNKQLETAVTILDYLQGFNCKIKIQAFRPTEDISTCTVLKIQI